jgi:hypothetical protein
MNFFRSFNKPLCSLLHNPLQRRNFSSCRYDDGIILTSPFLISLFSSSITAFFTITIITGNTNNNTHHISERLKKIEEKEKGKDDKIYFVK